MEKTTDEMLLEIVQYDYKTYGYPFVFLDYDKTASIWSITWRNPVEFTNQGQTYSKTPNGACKRALDFINRNLHLFKK